MSDDARQDYEIWKNALVYTITFRVVSFISFRSEGDLITLAACALAVTHLLQRLRDYVKSTAKCYDRITEPLVQCALFSVETMISAGIHMQSNLIGSYISSMFAEDTDAIYLVVSSVIGLVLIWVMGVTVGAY